MFWRHQETSVLVDIRGNCEETFLAGKQSHGSLWSNIAREISTITGKMVSKQQCINKWKSLKREWRKVTDNNKTSGMGRKTCPFQEQFDNLFSNRACEEPAVIVDSLDTNPPPWEPTANYEFKKLQEHLKHQNPLYFLYPKVEN